MQRLTKRIGASKTNCYECNVLLGSNTDTEPNIIVDKEKLIYHFTCNKCMTKLRAINATIN